MAFEMIADKTKTLKDISIAYIAVKKSKKQAYKCFHYLIWRLSHLGLYCPYFDDWADSIEWGKAMAKEVLEP
jgi:hypothetical protein